MKNAFEGFISRLDMAKERFSELEDFSIETSKTEKQRGKKSVSKDFRTATKGATHTMVVTSGKKKGIKEIFEMIMTENLSQINAKTKIKEA